MPRKNRQASQKVRTSRKTRRQRGGTVVREMVKLAAPVVLVGARELVRNRASLLKKSKTPIRKTSEIIRRTSQKT